MLFLVQRYLDPLDREILERALEGAVVMLSDGRPYDFDSDDELEAELRRELIEIAHSSDITDAEALRDHLLNAGESRGKGRDADRSRRPLPRRIALC
jgi:hypothetical protein